MAILLAITMAILPITMAQAAALGDHSHAAMQSVHGDGAAGAGHAHADDHAVEAAVSCDATSVGICGETASQDGTGNPCCGMGMCHAFQVSAAPLVSSPHLVAASLSLAGDEQVEGAFSGRLDRPPRTI